MGCPLLLFWPLVREVRGSRGGKAFGEEGEDAVMEMRLRENPQQFSSALLQLSTRYLFILGAQVCLVLNLKSESEQQELGFATSFSLIFNLYFFFFSLTHFHLFSVYHITPLSISALSAGFCFSLCSCYPQETPNGVEGFCAKVSA